MNVLDFIKYTKDHENEFKCYCEIIIGRTGAVVLAHPSHQEMLLKIGAKYNGISVEEYKNEIPDLCLPLYWVVSKENVIAVWYNRIIIPKKGLNRFQKRTINLLKQNGLLKEDLYIEETNEYQNHLFRKENYGVD